MPLVKTEGIVLQTRKYSETSKILTAFTKDQGRVSLLFKGGRKGTKKFPGGLETLNRVEMQYYQKGGRELQTFKSFDLIESYQGLRSDLKRTFTALSLAEIILKATAAEDANPGLFQSLTETLDALNVQEENPWAARWKGLLEVSRSLGFAMSLEGCCRCGGRGRMVNFDLSVGGFVCEKHKDMGSNLISTSGEIWGILRFLNHCPRESATRISVGRTTGLKIEALFFQYFKYHVPGLKNLESWNKLPGIYWGEEGN